MKKVLLIALLCCYGVLYSQDISRSTQVSSGGHNKNDKGYTLEWSVGGQFSQVIKSSHHLTEGFQQGTLTLKDEVIQKRSNDNIVENSSKDQSTIQPSWKIRAYPNPSTNHLYIDIIQEDFQGAIVYIYNLNGHQLAQQEIKSKSSSSSVLINSISSLPAGHYLLKITSPQASTTTISFVKISA